MKIILNKAQLNFAIPYFLQRAGYKYIVDRHTGKESFVRVIGTSGFPRWHLYLDEDSDKIVFNLHLDQKRPIYRGQVAHSGEYDNDLIKDELERLQTLLKSF